MLYYEEFNESKSKYWKQFLEKDPNIISVELVEEVLYKTEPILQHFSRVRQHLSEDEADAVEHCMNYMLMPIITDKFKSRSERHAWRKKITNNEDNELYRFLKIASRLKATNIYGPCFRIMSLDAILQGMKEQAEYIFNEMGHKYHLYSPQAKRALMEKMITLCKEVYDYFTCIAIERQHAEAAVVKAVAS